MRKGNSCVYLNATPVTAASKSSPLEVGSSGVVSLHANTAAAAIVTLEVSADGINWVPTTTATASGTPQTFSIVTGAKLVRLGYNASTTITGVFGTN
jgi:hypothetical protein